MAAHMLVNRAKGLVREPIPRPKRVGKTAKDRAKRVGSQPAKASKGNRT